MGDAESAFGKKITLRLFPDDLTVMKRVFKKTGYNVIVRHLVHQYVTCLLAEEQRELRKMEEARASSPELTEAVMKVLMKEGLE